MFAKSLSIWASALLVSTASAISITQSKPFPLGSEVENLAIRPNGNALVVVNTVPSIFEVEPVANATPTAIHNFANAFGASSISHSGIEKDVYFVITGNLTFTATSLTPEPNSYAIHKLSFDSNGQAIMEQLAHLDAIKQPNGMIAVPNTPYVLIADCNGGLIFRFDTQTGTLTKYFENSLLQPVQGAYVLFGVNGLKLSNGYLYFSNTNQEIVARIEATGKEACLEGSPETVVTQVAVDDFLVNGNTGDIYMALQTPNVTQQGFGVHHAGSASSSFDLLYATLGPTALRWARGAVGKTLVGTDVGNFFLNPVNNTIAGRIVEINL